MPSSVGNIANRSNLQMQTRLQNVEQARLAHPRRAGKGRNTSAQHLTKRLNAGLFQCACWQNSIAQSRELTETVLKLRLIHQVTLVGYQNGLQTKRLGCHQPTVYAPRVGVRLGTSKDHN